MYLPDFSFEEKLHQKGFEIVAGLDEVGRGAFAGPVVAGCVVFDSQRVTQVGEPQGRGPVLVSRRKGLGADEWQDPLINDSKKLTARQREAADIWIRNNAISYGIGLASVGQINKYGIKKASEIAFRKALKNCGIKIDYLLIDAFYIPYLPTLRRKNQKAIIRGDSLSISIAAASIIAKVYRDKLMTELNNKPKYKNYQWDKNKGYGTLAHRNAIRNYGTTKLHRKKFVENTLSRI